MAILAGDIGLASLTTDHEFAAAIHTAVATGQVAYSPAALAHGQHTHR